MPGERALERVRIAAVEERDHSVDLVLEVPSCERVTRSVQKPPVWGSNCALATLLEAFDLERENLQGLLGKRVPCTLTAGEGLESLELDIASLAEAHTTTAVTPRGFGDLELS
ncbi:hypothetical protein GCM10025298_23290 [Natronobiforma cellulositropha]